MAGTYGVFWVLDLAVWEVLKPGARLVQLEKETMTYTVTRRGIFRANLQPQFQCGSEGQSLFQCEITATTEALDERGFAIDNLDLLAAARKYDTEKPWQSGSCEQLGNGIVAEIAAKFPTVLKLEVKVIPSALADLTIRWDRQYDRIPTLVPEPIKGRPSKNRTGGGDGLQSASNTAV